MKNILVLLFLSTLTFCQNPKNLKSENMNIPPNDIEIATFAGGCFWCTEAIFLELKGVRKVLPGYTGGVLQNPTYKDICTGTTEHAEAIEITFDPNKISFQQLLEIFFATHDPTTLNRQGADVGTQYRSAIFYHNSSQLDIAKKYIDFLNDSNVFKAKIVTQLSPAEKFYVAEDYHHNYYQNNKQQPYCNYVILPKMNKLNTYFGEFLKQRNDER